MCATPKKYDHSITIVLCYKKIILNRVMWNGPKPKEESGLYLMHNSCRNGGTEQHGLQHLSAKFMYIWRMTFTRWYVRGKTSLQVSKLNFKMFSDFMHSNFKQSNELSRSQSFLLWP